MAEKERMTQVKRRRRKDMKWKYRRRTMLLTGERSQKKEVN